ncbi:transcription factor Adf-1-like [Bacillus rossius redtenbacheri]|uniref:transcription factor Adf-1-like n=1 Tax=Bacillus rossius redtenbacheri TaxID=93214 RepID=UPI002FDD27B6
MDDEKLISLVKSCSCLYDRSNADFKDANKRDRVWATISMHMGVSADNCQSRWRMLREKYTREKKSELSSSPEEIAARPQWLYMEQLAFLEPHIRHRNRRFVVRKALQSGDDKKLVRQLEAEELEENIEVVPVLPEEDLDEAPALDQRASRPERSTTAVLWRLIDELSSAQDDREDRDELFGRMVASELRSVHDPSVKKRMKFEIQTILFGDPE